MLPQNLYELHLFVQSLKFAVGRETEGTLPWEQSVQSISYYHLIKVFLQNEIKNGMMGFFLQNE